MRADQLKRRVLEIRAKHWEQKPGDRLAEHDTVVPCDVCLLLTALETAVQRRWDPFTGVPIR